MNQPKGNPSRLTTEQVIWCNCLVLALLVGRLGLGHYTFANKQLEHFSTTISALLCVFLTAVVFMGPKSIVRTISLLLAIPFAILVSIGACGDAVSTPEHPDRIRLAAKVGNVSFELVSKYDVTFYEIWDRWLELRMKRPVLNGILTEQETLISLQPALTANAELIDSGKNIRFISPALLGRKAIERTYSTEWDQARKNGHEHIQLTPAEQKAPGQLFPN